MMAELKVSGDVQPSDYEVMHLIPHSNVIFTASPTIEFLDVTILLPFQQVTLYLISHVCGILSRSLNSFLAG